MGDNHQWQGPWTLAISGNKVPESKNQGKPLSLLPKTMWLKSTKLKTPKGRQLQSKSTPICKINLAGFKPMYLLVKQAIPRAPIWKNKLLKLEQVIPMFPKQSIIIPASHNT